MNNEQLERMLVDLIGKVGRLIEGQARIEDRLERIESKIERLERKILFHSERIENLEVEVSLMQDRLKG